MQERCKRYSRPFLKHVAALSRDPSLASSKSVDRELGFAGHYGWGLVPLDATSKDERTGGKVRCKGHFLQT